MCRPVLVESALPMVLSLGLDLQSGRVFLFQTHPNVDKKLFTTESQIGLKNPEKSFPINSDVGVLKWRLQTTEESFIPLTSKCKSEGSGKRSQHLSMSCW